MSNEELEAYFEDLATRFKPVSHTPDAPHYCRFNIEEVVSGLVQTLDLSTWCLLLEAPTGQLEDNGADGYFDNQEIAFMLMQRVEVRNFPQERQVLSESRRLGVQLLAKIREEAKFTDLDINEVDYDKVGPVWANSFGYRFAFKVVDTVSLAIDPGAWDE